jgi:hypothetical protein
MPIHQNIPFDFQENLLTPCNTLFNYGGNRTMSYMSFTYFNMPQNDHVDVKGAKKLKLEA